MSKKIIRILSFLLCFCLVFEQSGFAQVSGELNLSGYFASLAGTPSIDKFRPVHLRYLSYDNQANNFKLLLDKGDSPKKNEDSVSADTKTLLNYFFIGVSLPNTSFWVNLRPDGQENIIDPQLAKTDIGRILLEADVQLKKDTALATSPQTFEGKQYWSKLYKKAEELFGYENITIPTLTRPWIVPNEIIIRESQDNAYIYKATLKVMLEQDYLKDSATYNFSDPRFKALNEYSSELIKELIIPKLNKEINTSKKYAALRQVYYSLILAQWFKARFYGKGGLYSWLIDKQNLNGLTSNQLWDKATYFQAYQQSFKDGEYNIKEPVSTPYGQSVRSYFSGGMDLNPGPMPPPGGRSGCILSVVGTVGRFLGFIGQATRRYLLGVTAKGNPQIGEVSVEEAQEEVVLASSAQEAKPYLEIPPYIKPAGEPAAGNAVAVGQHQAIFYNGKVETRGVGPRIFLVVINEDTGEQFVAHIDSKTLLPRDQEPFLKIASWAHKRAVIAGGWDVATAKAAGLVDDSRQDVIRIKSLLLLLHIPVSQYKLLQAGVDGLRLASVPVKTADGRYAVQIEEPLAIFSDFGLRQMTEEERGKASPLEILTAPAVFTPDSPAEGKTNNTLWNSGLDEPRVIEIVDQQIHDRVSTHRIWAPVNAAQNSISWLTVDGRFERLIGQEVRQYLQYANEEESKLLDTVDIVLIRGQSFVYTREYGGRKFICIGGDLLDRIAVNSYTGYIMSEVLAAVLARQLYYLRNPHGVEKEARERMEKLDPQMISLQVAQAENNIWLDRIKDRLSPNTQAALDHLGDGLFRVIVNFRFKSGIFGDFIAPLLSPLLFPQSPYGKLMAASLHQRQALRKKMGFKWTVHNDEAVYHQITETMQPVVLSVDSRLASIIRLGEANIPVSQSDIGWLREVLILNPRDISGDANVRRSAAEALGLAGSLEDIPYLEMALRPEPYETHQFVRDAAMRAIELIRSRNAPEQQAPSSDAPPKTNNLFGLSALAPLGLGFDFSSLLHIDPTVALVVAGIVVVGILLAKWLVSRSNKSVSVDSVAGQTDVPVARSNIGDETTHMPFEDLAREGLSDADRQNILVSVSELAGHLVQQYPQLALDGRLNYYLSGSLATMLLLQADTIGVLETGELPSVSASRSIAIPGPAKQALLEFVRKIGDLDIVRLEHYSRASGNVLRKGTGGAPLLAAGLPALAKGALKDDPDLQGIMCDPLETDSYRVARVRVNGKDFYIADPIAMLTYKAMHYLQQYSRPDSIGKISQDLNLLLRAMEQIYSWEEIISTLRDTAIRYNAELTDGSYIPSYDPKFQGRIRKLFEDAVKSSPDAQYLQGLQYGQELAFGILKILARLNSHSSKQRIIDFINSHKQHIDKWTINTSSDKNIELFADLILADQAMLAELKAAVSYRFDGAEVADKDFLIQVIKTNPWIMDKYEDKLTAPADYIPATSELLKILITIDEDNIATELNCLDIVFQQPDIDHSVFWALGVKDRQIRRALYGTILDAYFRLKIEHRLDRLSNLFSLIAGSYDIIAKDNRMHGVTLVPITLEEKIEAINNIRRSFGLRELPLLSQSSAGGTQNEELTDSAALSIAGASEPVAGTVLDYPAWLSLLETTEWLGGVFSSRVKAIIHTNGKVGLHPGQQKAYFLESDLNSRVEELARLGLEPDDYVYATVRDTREENGRLVEYYRFLVVKYSRLLQYQNSPDNSILSLANDINIDSDVENGNGDILFYLEFVLSQQEKALTLSFLARRGSLSGIGVASQPFRAVSALIKQNLPGYAIRTYAVHQRMGALMEDAFPEAVKLNPFTGQATNSIPNASDPVLYEAIVSAGNSSSAEDFSGQIARGFSKEEIAELERKIRAELPNVMAAGENQDAVGLVEDACRELLGQEEQIRGMLVRSSASEAEVEGIFSVLRSGPKGFLWFAGIVESEGRYFLGSEKSLSVNLIRFLRSQEELSGSPKDLVKEYILHEVLENSGLDHYKIIRMTQVFFARPVINDNIKESKMIADSEEERGWVWKIGKGDSEGLTADTLLGKAIASFIKAQSVQSAADIFLEIEKSGLVEDAVKKINQDGKALSEVIKEARAEIERDQKSKGRGVDIIKLVTEMALIRIYWEKDGNPPLTMKAIFDLEENLVSPQPISSGAQIITDYRAATSFKQDGKSYRVGGDGFLRYQLNKDVLVAGVFDVQGHGLSSALVKTLVLSWLDKHKEIPRLTFRPRVYLQELLGGLNDYLCEMFDSLGIYDSFCSAEFAAVDPKNHKFYYLPAGQQSIFLVRDSGRIEQLKMRLAGNITLGMFPVKYVAEEFDIDIDIAVFCMFGDGVYEKATVDRQDVSEERIHQVVEDRLQGQEYLLRSVVSALASLTEEPQDDYTVLAVELPGVRMPSLEPIGEVALVGQSSATGRISHGYSPEELAAIEQDIATNSETVIKVSLDMVAEVERRAKALYEQRSSDITKLLETSRIPQEQIDRVLEALRSPPEHFNWFYARVESKQRYFLGSNSGLAVNLIQFLKEQEGQNGIPADLIDEYILHEALEKTGLDHYAIIQLTQEFFYRNPTTYSVTTGLEGTADTQLGRLIRDFIEERAALAQPGNLDIQQTKASMARQLRQMRKELGEDADEKLLEEVESKGTELLGQIDELIQAGEIHPEFAFQHSRAEVKARNDSLGRPARIGVFATAGDPLHWDHILMLLSAIVKFKLDKVIFVLSDADWRKPGIRSFASRRQMIETVLKPFAPFIEFSDIAEETEYDGETNIFRMLALNSEEFIETFYIAGADHYAREKVDEQGWVIIDPATGKPVLDTVGKLERGMLNKSPNHSVAAIFFHRDGQVCESIEPLNGLKLFSTPDVIKGMSSAEIRDKRNFNFMPYDAYAVAKNLGLYGLGPASPAPSEGGMARREDVDKWIGQGDVGKLVVRIQRGMQGQPQADINAEIARIYAGLNDPIKQREFLQDLSLTQPPVVALAAAPTTQYANNTTWEGRLSSIDALIEEILEAQARPADRPALIVDFGTGYPPVTAVELAEKLKGKARVVGIDNLIPHCVVSSGDNYAFFDESGKYVYGFYYWTGRKLSALDQEHMEALYQRLIKQGQGQDYDAGSDVGAIMFNPHKKYSQNIDNLEFQWGDFEHLPLPEESVDILRVANVLRYYNGTEQEKLDKLQRLLRPGGVLIWYDEESALHKGNFAVFVKENGALRKKSVGSTFQINYKTDYILTADGAEGRMPKEMGDAIVRAWAGVYVENEHSLQGYSEEALRQEVIKRLRVAGYHARSDRGGNIVFDLEGAPAVSVLAEGGMVPMSTVESWIAEGRMDLVASHITRGLQGSADPKRDIEGILGKLTPGQRTALRTHLETILQEHPQEQDLQHSLAQLALGMLQPQPASSPAAPVQNPIDLNTVIGQMMQEWRTYVPSMRFELVTEGKLAIYPGEIKPNHEGKFTFSYQTSDAQETWKELILYLSNELIKNATEGAYGWGQATEVVVRVRLNEQSNALIFEISDDGEGIPKDVLEGVVQTGKYTLEHGSGLRKVREYVEENLGGKVNITTRPEYNGTMVQLVIPVTPPAAASAAPVKQEAGVIGLGAIDWTSRSVKDKARRYAGLVTAGQVVEYEYYKYFILAIANGAAFMTPALLIALHNNKEFTDILFYASDVAASVRHKVFNSMRQAVLFGRAALSEEEIDIHTLPGVAELLNNIERIKNSRVTAEEKGVQIDFQIGQFKKYSPKLSDKNLSRIKDQLNKTLMRMRYLVIMNPFDIDAQPLVLLKIEGVETENTSEGKVVIYTTRQVTQFGNQKLRVRKGLSPNDEDYVIECRDFSEAEYRAEVQPVVDNNPFMVASSGKTIKDRLLEISWRLAYKGMAHLTPSERIKSMQEAARLHEVVHQVFRRRFGDLRYNKDFEEEVAWLRSLSFGSNRFYVLGEIAEAAANGWNSAWALLASMANSHNNTDIMSWLESVSAQGVDASDLQKRATLAYTKATLSFPIEARFPVSPSTPVFAKTKLEFKFVNDMQQAIDQHKEALRSRISAMQGVSRDTAFSPENLFGECNISQADLARRIGVLPGVREIIRHRSAVFTNKTWHRFLVVRSAGGAAYLVDATFNQFFYDNPDGNVYRDIINLNPLWQVRAGKIRRDGFIELDSAVCDMYDKLLRAVNPPRQSRSRMMLKDFLVPTDTEEDNYFNNALLEEEMGPLAAAPAASHLSAYTGSGNTAIHLALDAARKMIAGKDAAQARQLLEELIADLEAAQQSQSIEALMDKWDESYPTGIDLLIADIPAAILDAQVLLEQATTVANIQEPQQNLVQERGSAVSILPAGFVIEGGYEELAELVFKMFPLSLREDIAKDVHAFKYPDSAEQETNGNYYFDEHRVGMGRCPDPLYFIELMLHELGHGYDEVYQYLWLGEQSLEFGQDHSLTNSLCQYVLYPEEFRELTKTDDNWGFVYRYWKSHFGGKEFTREDTQPIFELIKRLAHGMPVTSYIVAHHAPTDYLVIEKRIVALNDSIARDAAAPAATKTDTQELPGQVTVTSGAEAVSFLGSLGATSISTEELKRRIHNQRITTKDGGEYTLNTEISTQSGQSILWIYLNKNGVRSREVVLSLSLDTMYIVTGVRGIRFSGEEEDLRGQGIATEILRILAEVLPVGTVIWGQVSEDNTRFALYNYLEVRDGDVWTIPEDRLPPNVPKVMLENWQWGKRVVDNNPKDNEISVQAILAGTLLGHIRILAGFGDLQIHSSIEAGKSGVKALLQAWQYAHDYGDYGDKVEPFILTAKVLSKDQAITESSTAAAPAASHLSAYTGSGNTAIHLALDAARKMIAGKDAAQARQLLEELIADLEAAQQSQSIEALMDKWDESYPTGIDLLIADIPAAILDAQVLLSQVIAAAPVRQETGEIGLKIANPDDPRVLAAMRQRVESSLGKPSVTLAGTQLDPELTSATAILNAILSNPDELARLLTILSALRGKFSYQNVIDSPYTPLEYAAHNNIGLVTFNNFISVLETTESFRRHILRIEISPGKFVYVELKMPGDRRSLVNENDFIIPQASQEQYGEDNPLQRSLMKIEAMGGIELYGNQVDFSADNPLRVVVFEYIEAKRILDVPQSEFDAPGSGLRISDGYLQRVLENKKGMTLSALKKEILLQVINEGAMILDMGLSVMESSPTTFTVMATDLHLGNFALTPQGRVYFVSDCGSFRELEEGDGNTLLASASTKAQAGFGSYWIFNYRAMYLSELLAPLISAWGRDLENAIVIQEKENPNTGELEFMIDGLRIGSSSFHSRFSQHIKYYALFFGGALMTTSATAVAPTGLSPYTGSGNTAIHLALDAARKMISEGEGVRARALLEELIIDLQAARQAQDIVPLMDKWDGRYPARIDLLIADIPAAILDAQALLGQVAAAVAVAAAPTTVKGPGPYKFLRNVMRGLGIGRQIKDPAINEFIATLDQEQKAYNEAGGKGLSVPKKRALIIGAGAGRIIYDLRRRYADTFEFIAINKEDIRVTAEDFIKYLQQAGETLGSDAGTRGQIEDFLSYFHSITMVRDIQNGLGVEDGSLDYVFVAQQTMNYIENQLECVGMIKSALKPGGKGFISDWGGVIYINNKSGRKLLEEFLDELNKQESLRYGIQGPQYVFSYRYDAEGESDRQSLIINNIVPDARFPSPHLTEAEEEVYWQGSEDESPPMYLTSYYYENEASQPQALSPATTTHVQQAPAAGETEFDRIVHDWLAAGSGTTTVLADDGTEFTFRYSGQENKEESPTYIRTENRVEVFHNEKRIGYAHFHLDTTKGEFGASSVKMYVAFAGDHQVGGQDKSEAIFVDGIYSANYRGIGISLMGFVMRLAKLGGAEGIALLEVHDPGFFGSLGFDPSQQSDSMFFIFKEKSAIRFPEINIIRRPSNGGSPLPDSEPALSAADTHGGIDFRALPIAAQPMTVQTGLPIGPRLSSIDMQKEWLEIEKLLKAGITPSAERIKEYAFSACQQEGAGSEIDKILSCIADILRSEEDKCSLTDPALKELLVLLESGNQTQDFGSKLAKVQSLPKEPKIKP